MPNRKPLLLLMAALLAGVAGLIFILLQSGAGGNSLSDSSVLQGARTAAPDAATVLPEGASGTERGPLALAGTPGAADVGALSLAGPAPTRGSVSGRLVDEAGEAVAGEPVWLSLQDDAWVPGRDPPRLPQLAARGVAGDDGSFVLPASAGVEYDLRAGGKAWPATRLRAVHAGDQLLVTLPHATQLDGVVVDERTGAPVDGGRVMTVTDAGNLATDARPDGSFRLGPLPSQDVLVAAWAPGHDVKLVGNIAPAAGSLTVELPPGRTLSGVLVDRITAKPLAQGHVQLVMDVEAARAGGDVVPLTQLVQARDTDITSDGKFSFDAAPTMGFNLLCTADGYLPERYDRYEDRALNEGEDLIVQLDPAGAVTGHVQVAGNSQAAPDVDLALTSSGGELGHARSDASGDFALLCTGASQEALLARPEYVVARAGDLAARERVGRERDGLVLELVPVMKLSVQVVNCGTPVAGADVAARSKGAETTEGVTDAEGLVRLVHAPAGPDVDHVVLQARHADLESLALVLDTAAPPTGTITLDISSGAWIEGGVADGSGQPVPSARVSARPVARDSTDPRRSGYTPSDGHFRVGPLPPGVEYRVSFSAEGFLDQELPSVIPGGAPLQVTLAPVVRWSGRALDATTAQPLPDFWGQLVQETRQGDAVKQRPTNARLHLVSGLPGEFWFELPGPGSYLLRLSARDYVGANSSTFAFDGLRAPPFTELSLSPAAVLEITVLDGRSRPVPGYSVAAAPWELAREAVAPAGDLR
ncbi:MAG TPA: carboxypeptidase-like regulatory domain-containing protein [Planctomycetota bacterium]|nr:carboxypeptidase-like regulatory domain-containing protein [Planctomycetota bacterium]